MNEDNNPVDNVVTNMVEDSKEAYPALTEVFEAVKEDPVMMEKVRKAGRPPHLPTSDTRNKVYMLSTVGTRHEDIATVLSITHDTLVKYYKEELDKGRIEANASVAETLFKQAKEGNTTAMIFWLKSRARWKESTQHEISGNPDGTPVEVKIITGID